ncbi:hypothetical protein C438_03992 [Haloferax denitrificans ATCC 35960]|uniref:Uncharacterized protein n=1 Tax=Haloferax denitrificans ATCC 35960 TaxID=662478 RepID=M0JEY1_9EURY|nr:hypothetical protein C438_03992 [Haloferax denitrificans ATCC 35960]
MFFARARRFDYSRPVGCGVALLSTDVNIVSTLHGWTEFELFTAESVLFAELGRPEASYQL